MKIFELVSTITILIASCSNFAFAQTVEELNAQAALINADTARINAEAALNEAQSRLRNSRLNEAFGVTPEAGNEGTIALQANSETHFANKLVYASMHEAANDISAKICEGSGINEYVIFGDPSAYARAKRQLTLTEASVENMLERVYDLKKHIELIDATTLNLPRGSTTNHDPSIPENSGNQNINSAFPPIVSTLGTALPLVAGQFDNIASLFRSNYALSATTVNVSEATLIRSIKRAILEERRLNRETTKCPKINEPNLISRPTLPLLDKITELSNLTYEMQNAWTMKNAELIARRPAANVTTTPTRADYASVIAATSAQVTAANTAFTTLNNALFNPNTSGITRIETFQIANSLSNNSRFVAVTTEQSSALAIQSSKPLTSTKLSYTGIFSASYEIKKLDGEYVSIGFVNKSKCKKVKKKDGFFNLDSGNIQNCETTNSNKTTDATTEIPEKLVLNDR